MGGCSGKELKKEINDCYLPLPQKVQQIGHLEFNNELEPNEDKTELKTYSNDFVGGKYKRNSFDRFGDDLCELILSYLSLEDKFSFECVNRQWNHCLFYTVSQICLPFNTYENFVLKNKFLVTKKLIKKCKYLKKLKITEVCNNETLRLLSQNCKFLEEIDIGFKNSYKPIKRDVLTEFVLNSGQRIKSLILRIEFEEYKEVKQAFALITDLSKLQKINLTLDCVDTCLELNLKELLDLISKKCLDLKHIGLAISGQIYSSTPILTAFESLQCLHSIKLLHKSSGVQLGSIKSLDKFLNLTKLHILSGYLNDETLYNINNYCPNLESIILLTLKHISDTTLYSLSKIQNLRLISISCFPYEVNDLTDFGVMSLLNSCKNLRIIEFKCGINITQLTISTLNALADSSPNRKFQFSFCWERQHNGCVMECHCEPTIFNIWPQLKPENLRVESREYNNFLLPYRERLYEMVVYYRKFL